MVLALENKKYMIWCCDELPTILFNFEVNLTAYLANLNWGRGNGSKIELAAYWLQNSGQLYSLHTLNWKLKAMNNQLGIKQIFNAQIDKIWRDFSDSATVSGNEQRIEKGRETN